MDPSWTDIIQAIAAIIAVPGVIAAFIILFIKDKNRESEIESLTTIAGKLTKMEEDAEKRYKSSRKPHITLKVNHLQTKKLTIEFTNSNENSTLVSFESGELPHNFSSKAQTTFNHSGKYQIFSVFLSYKNLPPDAFTLYMNYITEEGYEFIQDIYFTCDNNVYTYSPDVIIDKQNSYLEKNK